MCCILLEHPTWNSPPGGGEGQPGAVLWGQGMCSSGGPWGVIGSPYSSFALSVVGTGAALCALKSEMDHFSPSAEWLQLWALCRLGAEGARGCEALVKQDMEGLRAVFKVDVSGGSPRGEAQPALLELFWLYLVYEGGVCQGSDIPRGSEF